eukprot:CAMPEP_0181341626 /NCGR_PEP_ID=MMETSP1101-20121128/30524_1 /TAXON_ID=46948 /ORGANISM="Rhodomonas abbreviata, Strain Caron Lab Isolate" /LENGTH=222 /DNA_ID=CAMNT_0023452943 /DNA_START=43 /DNA_END=708 /DNA_ORIENTATION=+
MSTIGMMDGAFFVGRKEIMEWVNGTLDLNLAKVEDTASGAVACQLLDIMYPGKVPMNKVNWSAKQSFEFVANYKVLQTCFSKLGIDRHIDVDRLISGKYMDNLEFMQWFKRFFEMSVSDIGDYDCVQQRSKGKGGATYGGGKKAPTAAAAKSKPAQAKPSAAPKASAAPAKAPSRAAAKAPSSSEQENAAPVVNSRGGGGASFDVQQKELQSLRQANEEASR